MKQIETILTVRKVLYTPSDGVRSAACSFSCWTGWEWWRMWPWGSPPEKERRQINYEHSVKYTSTNRNRFMTHLMAYNMSHMTRGRRRNKLKCSCGKSQIVCIHGNLEKTRITKSVHIPCIATKKHTSCCYTKEQTSGHTLRVLQTSEFRVRSKNTFFASKVLPRRQNASMLPVSILLAETGTPRVGAPLVTYQWTLVY